MGTNLTKKAGEICKKLRKEGFNGIRFSHAYVEDCNDPNEFESEAAYQAVREQYAAFVVEPIFTASFFVEDEGPYMEPARFDDRRFYKDLVAFVQKEVGEGVKVTHHRSCNEFEIERIK